MQIFNWQVSFFVGAGQDFETRYQEVLATQAIDPSCDADVQKGHDLALALVEEGSLVPPYDVYTLGSRNTGGDGAGMVQVQVIPETAV